LNRIRQRAIILEDTQSGLPFPSIESICEGADGTIWAATQNRVLVRKSGDHWDSDSQSDQCRAMPPVSPRTPRAASGSARARTGCTAGATEICPWGDDRALRGQTIHTLLVSKSGDLWIGQNRECDFAFARRSHHLVSD